MALSLSGNTLKIIAALSMLIDHIGLILFPDIRILRIIGRIAFPIFSFMISEGCKYTKNKPRYFLSVFSLALICQVFYSVFTKSLYMSILVTFSLSILAIYSLDYFKAALFSENSDFTKKLLAFFLFFITISGVYVLNMLFKIDYGFWGCMAGVFASVLKKGPHISRVYLFGIGLLFLAASSGTIQFYSLFALPLLLIYSGKRGKKKRKSFFYIFYPTHLVVLELIKILVS